MSESDKEEIYICFLFENHIRAAAAAVKAAQAAYEAGDAEAWAPIAFDALQMCYGALGTVKDGRPIIFAADALNDLRSAPPKQETTEFRTDGNAEK
jgi:hypothetical protein